MDHSTIVRNESLSTVSIQTGEGRAPEHRYRAIGRGRQYFGSTMGKALDALMADRDEAASETAVLIQRLEPDEYFTQAQQHRKRDLMARRARLSSDERIELEAILDAELDATVARTDRIVR